MKALIDTCIIIDALQSRKPFSDDAEKIFLAVSTNQCEGYITAKEVTDIYYLTHHLLHSREKTETIMNGLFTLFFVIDTCAKDAENAITSSLSDYEDAVMVETAQREHMDCIVTRNLKDYIKAAIPVFAPADFLTKICYKEPENL